VDAVVLANQRGAGRHSTDIARDKPRNIYTSMTLRS
jgi:hypothetical protein